jgi:hypothetical protein
MEGEDTAYGRGDPVTTDGITRPCRSKPDRIPVVVTVANGNDTMPTVPRYALRAGDPDIPVGGTETTAELSRESTAARALYEPSAKAIFPEGRSDRYDERAEKRPLSLPERYGGLERTTATPPGMIPWERRSQTTGGSRRLRRLSKRTTRGRHPSG